jgi:hypothetical protein
MPVARFGVALGSARRDRAAVIRTMRSALVPKVGRRGRLAEFVDGLLASRNPKRVLGIDLTGLAVIPTKSDQPRPGGFDRPAYRERRKVERAVGRLKQFRRVATRYEKRCVTTRPWSPSPP